jgi:hypothetical protein
MRTVKYSPRCGKRRKERNVLLSAARSLRIGAALLLAVTAVLVAGAGTARAQAADSASCVGIELSGISPPGTSTEFPGGAKELTVFTREFAGAAGITPGAIVSFVASLHEGSHEACDEAIFGD